MMRSMFSGVSGLRSHQTKMDVIANNIANVNTVGYKSHRVTFTEVFYQKISGASGPNANSGRAGVNSMQIGLGSAVGSISKLMTNGAPQRTDDPYDLMIDGDGFFIVGDANGTYFTRAGAFVVDEDGYLATAGGLMVKGWKAIPNPNEVGSYIIQKGMADNLQIMGPAQEFIDPAATTLIDFTGNLNALTDPVKYNSISFFDTVGNNYTVDTRLSYLVDQATGQGYWDIEMGTIAYPNNVRSKPIYLDIDNTGYPPAVTIINIDPDQPPPLLDYISLGTLNFDTVGHPIGCVQSGRVADMNSIQFRLTVDPAAVPNPLVPNSDFGGLFSNPDGTQPPTYDHIISLNFNDIRQFGTQTANASSEMRDGNAPGKLERVNFGQDGKITGGYTNGLTRLLGQVVVAHFANPAGLEKFGDNLFVLTPNSGEFDGVGEEVQASGGDIRAGALEMSNVDLASEFTEMITTQRGFQANSRVITTSDDMLQELVNLKR